MLTISKDVEITPELACRYMKSHNLDIKRLNTLHKYYKGEHSILNRQKDARLANNKLVCNHAKYITDTAVGYLTGNPVQYESKNGKQDLKAITEWLDKADSPTQDTDLARNASIFGRSYEMLYMSGDDKPQPCLASIDPRHAFVVYDGTVEEKPVFGVYYYPVKDESGKIIKYHCYLSVVDTIYEFDTTDGFEIKNEVTENINPFRGVCIIEYYNNGDLQSDFEPVISLIDAYNVLQSDRVNDKEQFVKAILLIKGQILGETEKEESEAFKQIFEMGLLVVDSDTSVEWLSRQLEEESVEILRKSLEQDIHKFSNVPCMTDEKFGSNASGVAMKYKLLGFEQMIKIKERYFKEGLKIRLKLFANALELTGHGKIDTEDIGVAFTRSLPVNEIELAQTVNALSDLVPLEQLLKILPFVNDPEKAAGQIEKQRKERDEAYKNSFQNSPYGISNEKPE